MQSILLFSEKLSRSWALSSSFLMCLNTVHVPLSDDPEAFLLLFTSLNSKTEH